jgi:hypothetical protein
MPTYSVGDVLEIIKGLTPEQKQELQRGLAGILEDRAESVRTPVGAQTMSGVSISHSSDVNLSQVQAGQGSTMAQTRTAQTFDWQAALESLGQLKQAVSTHETLNPLVKEVVAEEIGTLETEIQKPEPDKGMVDRAIETLKKGLTGVAELAEPLTKVANLVAKAWTGMP